MKVFVNDTELVTFCGATVKAAVLAYLKANKLPLNTDDVKAKDAYGNIIDLDGALRSNTKIYVKL